MTMEGWDLRARRFAAGLTAKQVALYETFAGINFELSIELSSHRRPSALGAARKGTAWTEPFLQQRTRLMPLL